MATKLFRPVGINELALIWDSGMREFPPRFPDQPIFYPVTNIDYARQIARDWNTLDEKSGFSGFVTAFEVDSGYLSNFAKHKVGSSTHEEYWIPSSELERFNKAINGLIQVVEAHFGPAFKGFLADHYGLEGRDAIAQFVALAKTWDYSSFDVTGHVSANRKAVYLNWLYWLKRDFSEFGIDSQHKQLFVEKLKKVWEYNRIEVPLPIANDACSTPG
jgi:hypothetical protein